MPTTQKDFSIAVSEPVYPVAKKLTMEDVWGRTDEHTLKLIDTGMIVARGLPLPIDDFFTQEMYDTAIAKIADVCPVWGDVLPYKSVTAICKESQMDEVSYWLEYVHGADCIEKIKAMHNGHVAIRSNYMCW